MAVIKHESNINRLKDLLKTQLVISRDLKRNLTRIDSK
jgi:hypothetical protein